MNNNSSARYCQKNKESLQNKVHEVYENLEGHER